MNISELTGRPWSYVPDRTRVAMFVGPAPTSVAEGLSGIAACVTVSDESRESIAETDGSLR